MNRNAPNTRPIHGPASAVLATVLLGSALWMVFGETVPASAQALHLGDEFQVNQSTTLCPRNPQVLAQSDGDFSIFWANASSSSVQARYYDAQGSPLGNESTLESGTDIFMQDIAGKPDGSFVMVWSEQTPGVRELHGRRYASDGSPIGTDFEVTTTASYPDFASVAMDEQGEFVVAWSQGSAPNRTVEARRFAADGMPIGSIFPISASVDSYDPDVAKQADSGEFVVAWSGPDDVWAKRYDSGGSAVGSEFVVNSYTTGVQTRPALEISTSGDMLVAFEGALPGTPLGQTVAVLTSLDHTGAVLATTEVGDSATTHQDLSLAATADLGTVAVAWDEVTEGPGGVLAFDIRSAYNAIIDQTVTLTETGPQMDTAIAVDPAGRMTLAWTTDPDGNDCFDIFAIRAQLFQAVTVGEFDAGIHSPVVQAGWKYYLLVVPAGDYEISLKDLTGDLDLYVRTAADPPTLFDFDCRPFQGGLLDETCTIRHDGVQTIWVGVNGFDTGTSHFTFSVESIPPLFVDGFESGDTSLWSATVN